MSPTAHSFLSCQKRMGRKEALGYEIALMRLKTIRYTSAFYRYTSRSPNALRAAQTIFALGMSYCGEYLTYGS